VLAELHAGNPARFVVGGDPDSLVEHLLAANGVSSMVTVPIHCDDEGLLLLALGTVRRMLPSTSAQLLHRTGAQGQQQQSLVVAVDRHGHHRRDTVSGQQMLDE